MKMDEDAFSGFLKQKVSVSEFLTGLTDNSDLGAMLKKLQDVKASISGRMSGVLHKQTDSILAIVEQLQTLYTKIAEMNAPISQLCEECKIINGRLYESVTSYDADVKGSRIMDVLNVDIVVVQAFQCVLIHTQYLTNKYKYEAALQSDNLERVISKYAFYNQTLNCMRMEQAIPDVEIRGPLLELMNAKFLVAFESDSVDEMRRIFEMYVVLKDIESFVVLISDEVIAPKLYAIFSEEHLAAEGNLEKLYQEARCVLEHDLKLLAAVVGKCKQERFCLVLDCFWPVVDRILCEKLISVTSAGHPDLFFYRYKRTEAFLGAIAAAAGDKTLTHKDATFINHLKRFNLSVYYEIRHQTACANLETSIVLYGDIFSESSFYMSTNTVGKLHVTAMLYLQACYLFDSSIFLPVLSDQFLKSLCTLLARYTSWIRQSLVLNKASNGQNQLKICAYFLADIEELKNVLGLNASESSLYDMVENSCQMHLKEALNRIDARLDELYGDVKEFVFNKCINEMLSNLNQVGAIPRLYRRTNRPAPTLHSSYVTAAIEPIHTLQGFFSDPNPILTPHHLLLTDELITEVATEFYTFIADVMHSVCKTEESIRRLKSRTGGASQEDPREDYASDEAKIRSQIKLDVEFFNTQVEPSTSKSGVQALLRLLEIANN